LAFRDALPDYLKGYVTFAYKTGWRKEEMESLDWNHVDLKKGVAWIDPGRTKNDKGKIVYLDAELKQLFSHQWEKRKKTGILTQRVFPNKPGTDKIKYPYWHIKKPCRQLGLDKILHDFRRTAVRNMVRAGIRERVAMQLSGHKTRRVFERYNIVNDANLELAAHRQED
jgi:integrase